MQRESEKMLYARLSVIRRRLVLSRLPAALTDALTPAAWVLLPAVLLVRFFGLSMEILLVLPCIFCAGFAVSFFRAMPSWAECAAEADRMTNTQSLAATALELTVRSVEGEFAAYAVRLGLEQLESPRIRFPFRCLRWKRLFIPLLFSLFLTSLPYPAEQTSVLQNGKRRTAEQQASASAAADAKYETGDGGLSGFSSVAVLPGTGIPVGGEGSGNRRTGLAANIAQRPGNASADAAGQSGGRGEPEEAVSQSLPEKTSGSSGGESSGNGGSEGGEGGENSGMNAGLSSGDRSRSEQRRKRREVRRGKEFSRGGVQPLLSDGTKPAGRELSDKEGHGDDPGDGRGGDTGAKKSRGTASALPAVPLPDVVSGRLGAGADLTSSVSSSSGAAERRPVSSPVSAVREPRGFRRVMPARLRLEQRRLTESESVENKGTGI